MSFVRVLDISSIFFFEGVCFASCCHSPKKFVLSARECAVYLLIKLKSIISISLQ